MTIRILLVEDNALDAQLVSRRLQMSGAEQFVVALAPCLADALRSLEVQHFDVALLDLTLPDSIGLNTLRTLVAAAPGLPVIVLTGIENERTGLEAVQIGAQDYLLKNQIDGPWLWRAIRYALERKRHQRSLHELASRTEACLHDLIDSLPLPVLCADAAGAITRGNRLAAELAGRAVEGLGLAELLPDGVAHWVLSGQGEALEGEIATATGPRRMRVSRTRLIPPHTESPLVVATLQPA